MKKLKYFFASAIVLVAVAVSTIVFAEYKEQKGDLRVGNTISNKNVSVNAGSSNLINDGDVKVVKTVSKTDTDGVYNVKFDISAKEKENTKTTPIYAVVAFDNSGSMICDSAKGSYAYSKADAEKMTRNYNYNYNKRENLNYYFEEYKSALGDNTSVYCTKYTEEPNGWFSTELVKIDGEVVLKDKWESAVNGAKAFTSEILSIDSSKISYVPFASSAQTASKWYANGDTIPSSVYSHPVGATNLSDAINKAYNKLSERTIPTNAKKIIIVISDGEPTEPGNYPIQSAKDSANKAKKAGIKIYSIGYAVAKDSTAANVLENVSSNSANDTTNYSFLAGQDNVSDIFKKLATDITTVYAKDATLTDTIGGSFKFTSSNDNVKVNGQNVSFSIDKLTRQTQSFSFNITIDDENITEDGWYPTNDGFNLTYTDVYGNSQKITSPEDPEVYWVAKRYDYKIEYYYDGQIDNTLTEPGKDVKGKEIIVSEESINNNTKEGYSLTSVNPSTRKIVISSSEENVIRVYYERNSYDYEVHYFFNGNEDESLIDRKSAKYNDVINTYTDKVKTGYKLDRVETLPLTIGVENNIINVYYVTDKTQTKTLTYTVNYYKDGNLVKEDTETIYETKQVLESDTLTVKSKEINIKDKYVGYKFVKTNPELIPEVIENKGVIDVYYERNSYDYEVHYFFNGNEDESLIDRKSAKYNDVINTYTDKVKTGYKLDRVETLPLTIGVENNIINVYYVTDKTQTKTLTYTVNYYKDGNLVKEDTETIYETKQVLESDTLTVKSKEINVTNKYVGYKFEKTNPETIPNSIEDKGVIKVYYVFDENQTKELSYTVEYYKNGKKVENDTQVETVTVHVLEPNTLQVNQDKINTENKYVGYKLEKTNPETIPSEINNGGIIKVYYILDDGQTKTLTYTVNYYKDGNLVKEDTETIYETKQVLESDTLTVKSKEINIKDKYVGYKFVKTNPELIPEVIENKGVIDVYYEKDTFTYEVRYYFNRELDESLTEKGTALFGDKITSYTDKVKEDYTLETVENLPLVISEDESKNIINVYYKIDGQGVIEPIEPIEPPHTSANNSIYALILLVNALGVSVLLKKREN